MNTFKSRKAKATLFLIVPLLLAIAFFIMVIMKDEEKAAVYQPERIAEIQITLTGFEPASISVKKGTKIIWTNTDEAMHQLASNSHPSHQDIPGLKSEILNNGQTYEYKADKSGSYGYHDEINPTLNGTIEVQN